MVITGSSLASTRAAIELVRSDPQRFRCTAGVHPHHAAELDEPALQRARRARAQRRRSWRSANVAWTTFATSRRAPAQLAAFRRQLELAAQLRKPVFLHQRDAHEDFVAILREYRPRLVGGVAHCFTAGVDEARAYLDLGSAHRHHRLDLRRAPRPAPARGRAHDPGGAAADRNRRVRTCCRATCSRSRRAGATNRCICRTCLRAIAAARGESPQELAALTTRNALTLFGWPTPAAEV